MAAKRRKFTGSFKAKVAIEALKERETLAQLSKRLDIHPNMISKWKQHFTERAEEVFETSPPDTKKDELIEKLYTKIGKLEMERDWLKKTSKTTEL